MSDLLKFMVRYSLLIICFYSNANSEDSSSAL